MQRVIVDHNSQYRKVDVTLFDSIQDLMDTAQSFAPQFSRGYTGYAFHGKNLWGRSEFIGREFKDYHGVKDATNSAWPDGLEPVERAIHSLASKLGPPKSVRRRPRYDDFSGDDVDLDRLRGGQSYWRECHRDASVQVRTVTILADVTTPGSYRWDRIMWRGVAAIVLAYKLEEVGYRSEIWSVNGTEVDYNGRPRNGYLITNLKRTPEPLDLSGLVNAVSPWFYRGMMFCAKGALAEGRQIAQGYGTCIAASSQVLDLVTTDPQRIYVNDIWSEGEAISFLNTKLKEFA